MVQVSLKNKFLWACVCVALLLLVLLLMTRGERHAHTNNSCQCGGLPVVDEFIPHPHVVLSPARKAELKTICAGIAKSYSNDQVEVLYEWRTRLPEMLESLGKNDLREIRRPIAAIIYNELHLNVNKILRKEPLDEEFGGEEEFVRHANALVAIAFIDGDVSLRRGDLGRIDDLEPWVFFRLKSYRDSFKEQGRSNLERAADLILAKWIDQIESEDGYTRTILRDRIANNRKWGDVLMSQSGLTWEEVAQGAVSQTVHILKTVGYTPKWLDEFKNIPRHATPREEEPSKK